MFMSKNEVWFANAGTVLRCTSSKMKFENNSWLNRTRITPLARRWTDFRASSPWWDPFRPSLFLQPTRAPKRSQKFIDSSAKNAARNSTTSTFLTITVKYIQKCTSVHFATPNFSAKRLWNRTYSCISRGRFTSASIARPCIAKKGSSMSIWRCMKSSRTIAALVRLNLRRKSVCRSTRKHTRAPVIWCTYFANWRPIRRRRTTTRWPSSRSCLRCPFKDHSPKSVMIFSNAKNAIWSSNVQTNCENTTKSIREKPQVFCTFVRNATPDSDAIGTCWCIWRQLTSRRAGLRLYDLKISRFSFTCSKYNE